ncbi:MAG: hypothetical protein HY855_19930, partial [Burkholderiales bacterium]|nr:hypothetical protein [Burkholderiales bacterium]
GAPLAGPRPTAGDAWHAWVDSLCAEPAGPRDSLVVALRICHALGAGARPGRAAGRAPWPQPPAADAADPGATVPPPDAAAGEGEGADPGAPDLTLLGAESQPGAGSGGALATPEVPPTTGPADAADAEGTPGPPAAGAARVDGRPARQRFVYDEWNHLTQRYLAGWCQVHEQRLQGDEVGFGREVRRRHATLARQVRRQFGAIRPEAWQRVHRTRDGDDFELDALVDAVVERRAGRIGDERLYLWRERAAREVAAAFLVDMSASTDFPVPDSDAAPAPAAEPEADDEHPMLYGGWFGAAAALPPAPRRRVIDVAKESLALMCDALHLLGDRHAVYGFSGRGRENVEFWVAKDFRDALTPRTWAALAAMQPRGATRMGAAVRHALAKLAREPARLKLLIIVSDGYPQDSDYGPKPAGRGLGNDDAEYGIQDTAQALREAERAGVIPFHVTIDPAGHDYLRRMCAEQRYLVIDDVRALPEALGKVYRALAT